MGCHAGKKVSVASVQMSCQAEREIPRERERLQCFSQPASVITNTYARMKHASTGGSHQSIVASHDKCASLESLTFNRVWHEDVTEAWSLAEGQQRCGFLIGLDLS